MSSSLTQALQSNTEHHGTVERLVSLLATRNLKDLNVGIQRSVYASTVESTQKPEDSDSTCN